LIAVGTNIRVCADRSDLSRHEEAVVSHVRVFASPTSPKDAFAAIEALRERPSCRPLMP